MSLVPHVGADVQLSGTRRVELTAPAGGGPGGQRGSRVRRDPGAQKPVRLSGGRWVRRMVLGSELAAEATESCIIEQDGSWLEKLTQNTAT